MAILGAVGRGRSGVRPRGRDNAAAQFRTQLRQRHREPEINLPATPARRGGQHLPADRVRHGMKFSSKPENARSGTTLRAPSHVLVFIPRFDLA